jgi:hypothetical protein
MGIFGTRQRSHLELTRRIRSAKQMPKFANEIKLPLKPLFARHKPETKSKRS